MLKKQAEQLRRVFRSVKVAGNLKRKSAKGYERPLMAKYGSISDYAGPKECVFMVDGTAYNPGLCDKLRGLLSVFDLCLQNNISFKIYWDYPFELVDYLAPNAYDWFISQEGLRYDSSSRPVVIDHLPNIIAQERIDMYIFRRRVCKTSFGQYHVYTNMISEVDSFRGNFDRLFRMTDKLREALAPHSSALGADYVSFSLRFMELLGDFKDHEGVSTPLPESEREALKNKCFLKLIEIANGLPSGTKFFLASDSRSFLEYVAERDKRFYTVPGEIVHTRYRGSDESVMKTFVDLFLLRGAKTCYLLKTGKMYNSGFPRFASWIGGGDFRLIEF